MAVASSLGQLPLLLLLLLLLLFNWVAAGASEEQPVVEVAQGLVRGRKVESSVNGSYFSFLGIPYAKPPLGPLRFKDAQPPEPWAGVLDADLPGPACVQSQYQSEQPTSWGSEDCLHLNVFTPRLPPDGPPLPVMVWIHGGGFVLGSSDPSETGPDYLVAEGVVMVSINYRLGVFGFLYLNHPAAAGNIGLKDQVAALRWVQNNIAAFGGNPGNVTIFGQSAGGASVHFQMLSPMSKGLFHRAIAQSGAVLNPWGVQYRPEDTARRLASALGCSAEDPEEIVNFLRGVDRLELQKAANEDAPFPREKDRFLAFSFVPTPELAVPGVETFLPAPAKQLMDEGLHHPVPYLAGVNSREAIFILSVTDIRKPDIAAEVDGSWNRKVLPELRLPPDYPEPDSKLEALRRFFLGGKPLANDTVLGFIDMMSDLQFGEGVQYAVRRMAEANTAPVFYYNLTLDTELNYVKQMAAIDFPGAAHGEEAGYMFKIDFWDPDLPEDSVAAVARRRVVRLWTNFAKTGNPTPAEDPLLGARWPPYSERERAYLEIGAQLRPGADLNPQRAQFWEDFYPE